MGKEVKIVDLIKKKKKYVKVKKVTQPKWVVIHESDCRAIDMLFDIYRKDKKKARVLYEDKGSGFFVRYRVVLYEESDGKFAFVNYIKNVGISKNNVIYTREKKISSIIYSKGKLYITKGLNIKALTYGELDVFCTSVGGKMDGGLVMDYMIKKFSWIRFIEENNHGLRYVSFNRIIAKKLYSYNDLIKDVYKTNLPLALKLIKDRQFSDTINWLKLKNVLTTEEDISDDFLGNEYLFDTTNLAYILGYKINPRWSKSRIKIEHDNMSNEHTDILLEFQPLVVLKIGDIFEKFSTFSGYPLIRNNKDLFKEGKMMQHCVGGYSGYIERGECGIYKLDGYTLEVRVTKKDGGLFYNINNSDEIKYLLNINQCRGFKNSLPPLELYEEIYSKLKEFGGTKECEGTDVLLEDNYEIKQLRQQKLSITPIEVDDLNF